MTDIAINGRFLTRPATGVDRFATELLRAWLPLRGRQHGVKTLVPPQGEVRAVSKDWPAGLTLDTTRVGKLGGHAWEQIELSGHCDEAMLLSLCNTGPVTRRRQLAVLHDAGVMVRPETYSFAFRNWYRWMFAGLMRRAELIATVSRFSASELVQHFGRRAAGIELIPGAGEHVLRAEADPRVLDRCGLVGRDYVLAVGSHTPNKNFSGVVRAAALLGDLDCKIVAAGGVNGTGVFGAAKLPEGALILPGYVTDGELRALYENARCFVFPSFYEGFGLPPIEAMHCGCPVVVSERASLPEVCGEAAVYCDPDDPADIAKALRLVLTSPNLQSELREAGLARARRFSWHRSAALLDELLTSSTAARAAA